MGPRAIAGLSGAHPKATTAAGRGRRRPRSCLFVPEATRRPQSLVAREGLNNPHLGRNAIGCGSKIRFEDLSER